MPDRLTRHQAAQIAVTAQLLGTSSRRNAMRQNLSDVVRHLACIQLDTISIVARSQYIIPWSRIGAYDQTWLDEMFYPDRQLFEYWGHAASLIDSDLLPCFISRMRAFDEKYVPERYPWLAENQDMIQHVRRRLADEGPLTSLDFERPDPNEPVEPWEWYGGKPTNRALDYLWRIGEVGIRRRINFRREYDLLERVHPEVVDMAQPETHEERKTLAERALRAMGICRPEWLNDYFRTTWGARNSGPPGPRALLDSLVADGRAIPVEINGLGPAFVSVEQESTLQAARDGYTATRTTLLSPFDNLIWDRQRTLELFDFFYKIECYTPEAQRRYGYYTMPILRRGRLVGRIDPKMDRSAGEFIVRSLHLEPGIRLSNGMISDISGTLRAFARWNGARTLRSECGVPPVIVEATDGPV